MVESIEKEGRGLNLTWEVRDGILNHRISGNPSTMEGQVVRLADKLAYIHHDMDDAQRAGIITEDDIPVTLRMLLGYTTRERLNTFVHDIIESSMEKNHIEMSSEIYEAMMDLRKIMFQNVYDHPEAKKEENSDNRCMAAWCHGAPGILLARSKMYNLVKDSSDYITVQCDIERALFATKMYGFTDNDCLCHGNLGNTEILLEYSKECNDEEVRHMMLSARTQIAMDIINENYDCARSYLHGYKIPGFMTGISGMGYSLLRDLYPELPCILALEI